ncbi:glycoside hydrolase family 63 protein [Fomitiporia mediterranea MF3/22]|uniref:glycoside hydrolase family 63 protein n=1 Tax=Fomitiporia mediterranea (strain MF3/22) TaxID=694068 RepID=UPI00044090F0|nr:glycoside hydrolase family 63 protein [Fomitiporia mediterranea MF3/22]EJD02084.1 glycoside hydrolase family 63 protein [Fomitiporia mediterranea MF3/22]
MRSLLSFLLLPLILGSVSDAAPSNDSQDLLWGTYRPNLYFGLRPRLPQSLLTGLIWYGTQDFRSFQNARHACEQGDGLAGYTWTEHDPREGGVQVLNDPMNNVKVTTELLKVNGGEHGGSWAARVKGEPLDPEIPSRTSFIFYFGVDGLGGIDMDTDEDENGLEGTVKFSGSTPDLGDFSIRVEDGPNNNFVTNAPHAHAFAERIGKTHFLGLRMPPGEIWRAREHVMNSVLKNAQAAIEPYQDPAKGAPDPSFVLQLPDEVYSASNLYAVQKSFDGEFQFDVFFESASTKQKLDSSLLDNGIPAFKEKFARRFNEKFPMPAGSSESLIAFSKAITSNLLGGVGYFYGDSIVDPSIKQEWDEDEMEDVDEKSGPQMTEPKALLTATPSRSFFPRGFYWDEGFHLLHIGAWDNDFSLEILKDWINLIDEDGWVAREQILGEEARSKVPMEFITQVPSYANPPTLTMAVTAFIDRLKAFNSGPSTAELGMDFGVDSQIVMEDETSSPQTGDNYLRNPELAQEFLRSIYPKLKRHYDWFRRTQRGQIKQYGRKARSRTEAYRWRGRSEQHVLTSGMDDYPRGPPHAGELHLDLMSWMAFFTRTMRDIAGYIGETDDENSFIAIEKAILDNLEDLHWSEEDQMYCDVGVNSDDESYFVCHKGYLSLFPVLLGLLEPSSPHLGPTLEILRSPDHLWSPYGIRSLSASHPEFGQGENYWKGPIWIQMNYMALSSLYKVYAKEPGPHQSRAREIYTELRKNIIDNVFKEYERTGYVWEQYDALTGEGRRSHPFTGWTSLVAMSKHLFRKFVSFLID